MVIGKNDIENHIGLFSFIADYCALFMDNVELLEQTNKFANTDTLTGLYTHRGFQEVLSAELRRAEENDSNLSIIMLDVNNISKINRELGHRKGDEVIKLVAEKVKHNLRKTDIAGRYGGDEIAMILPNTDVAEAKYIAEYITYTLSCCFIDDVGPVKVASFGFDHHRKVSDVDPAAVLDVLLHSVLVDLEADVHGGHVVEVPEPGLHRGDVVAVSVRLDDLGLLDPDGGLGLGVDAPVLQPPPSDDDLDVPSVGALRVQLYDAAGRIVGGHPDVVHDPLHPAVRIVRSGEEVVKGGDMVVYNVLVPEIKID